MKWTAPAEDKEANKAHDDYFKAKRAQEAELARVRRDLARLAAITQRAEARR